MYLYEPCKMVVQVYKRARIKSTQPVKCKDKIELELYTKENPLDYTKKNKFSKNE